jgi:predicted O-methyltransferase YrrM
VRRQLRHDRETPSPADVASSTRASLEAALDGVDGWLHVDEAARLYEAVAESPGHPGELRVVEIGSWKGRSTIALGLAAQTRAGSTVVAIDPHLGDNGEFSDGEETFTDFLHNLERAGVADVVQPVRERSHDARPMIKDGSVGVLFLDGSHRYQDVRRDLDDWISALTAGATLACNDSSKPGVYRALRETVLRRGAAFRQPQLVRSTLFVEHRPGTPWTPADHRQWIRLSVVLALRRSAHWLVPYLPAWVKRTGNRISERAVQADR